MGADAVKVPLEHFTSQCPCRGSGAAGGLSEQVLAFSDEPHPLTTEAMERYRSESGSESDYGPPDTDLGPSSYAMHYPPLSQTSHEKSVYVNLYDLDARLAGLNRVTGDLRLGGVLHVGIEVYALELTYGLSGIGLGRPRQHSRHTFRESLAMGTTPLSYGEVMQLVSDLQEAWPPRRYDFLDCNCASFSDALCLGLQVGPLPLWVTRLTRMGRSVPGVRELLLLLAPNQTEATPARLAPKPSAGSQGKVEGDDCQVLGQQGTQTHSESTDGTDADGLIF